MKRFWFVVGSAILIAAALYFYWPREDRLLHVDILNIGQGDAIHIRTPDGATVVVDAGPDNSVVHELAAVMPWWDQSIDYVFLTHADFDHIGGAPALFEHYEVGEIVVNGLEPDKAYMALILEYADAQAIPVRTVRQGSRFQFSSEAFIDILWPPPEYELEDPNDGSLVMRLVYGEAEALLTGDAGIKEEKIILGHGTIESDLLKVGHHGSRTSTAPEFTTAVRPRFCAISAGKENKFGHPHPDVLETLRAAGCQILSTIESGRLRFTGDGGELTNSF